ncbi:MAG: peptidyl-prolyl cis-trans isomerase [Alphaproteobacteria bacterium]
MVMQAMYSGKGSKLIKGFFFTLLVLAAGGLVLSDVGGFFTGGVGRTDIAKVGSEKISIVSFDKNARRVLSRMGMTPDQAYEMGYLDRILDGEVRRMIFQKFAEKNGIKISDKLIARQISEMLEGQSNPGEDMQATFTRLLMSQGFTEAEFVSAIASEGATSVLAHAVQNPYLAASERLAQDMFSIANETRVIDYIVFPHDDYKNVEEASDQQLQILYEASRESFAIPESRNIRVAVIKDDALKAAIDVTDEKLRSIYESEIDVFQIPEERKLEQAILESESDAQKILEKLNSGTAFKAAVSEVTGSELSYVAEQNYRQNGLTEDIAAKIFAQEAQAGNVFGPVQSPIGWHVIKLNGITPPYTRSFENVKNEIKNEILESELADRKFEISSEVDDLLASGAPIEEIAQSVDLDITVAEDIKLMSFDATSSLDVFGENSSMLLGLAFDFPENESSNIVELQDGRMAFVHVDQVAPKSYIPFEEVEDQIKERWTNDQKRMNNRNATLDILETSKAQGLDLKEIAKAHDKTITALKDIKKNASPPEPFAQASIAQIFSARQGDMIMIDLQNGVAIAVIREIKLPEIDDKALEQISQIRNTNRQSAMEETLTAFYEHKKSNYRVSVNHNLMRRTYGPSSEF